jgi:hypothetical protein
MIKKCKTIKSAILQEKTHLAQMPLIRTIAFLIIHLTGFDSRILFIHTAIINLLEILCLLNKNVYVSYLNFLLKFYVIFGFRANWLLLYLFTIIQLLFILLSRLYITFIPISLVPPKFLLRCLSSSSLFQFFRNILILL